MALYRKYRSQSFDAVVGQPHVVDTITSAIKNNRVSHAYLFTGPRGTGKTSVARLLARAVNCTDSDPSKRPCGTCANCQIEIGSHLDLIEIDAASNRGIDDARALRDKITSAPSIGKYKVYIIDEVHMLTTEAFNALLKTLEEPPAHAIFILATTEFHKMPETIVSRTQRFSFKPINEGSIATHLKQIAIKEKIDLSDDAATLIAHSSRGGFRDAISLLDQAAANSQSKVDLQLVRDLLGHSDPELVDSVINAVDSQDVASLLSTLDQIWSTGIQPGQFARQLIEAWRLKIRKAAAEKADPFVTYRAVSAVETLIPVLKNGWPELALEAALVKMASGNFETNLSPRPIPSVVPSTIKTPKPVLKPAGSLNEGTPLAPSSQVDKSASANQDMWMKALTQIKQKNNPLYALLRSSVSVHFEADEVILGCRFVFHRDRIKETKNTQLIEQTLAKVYGRKYRVLVQLESKQPKPAQTVDPSTELMSSALEILGGEVVHD